MVASVGLVARQYVEGKCKNDLIAGEAQPPVTVRVRCALVMAAGSPAHSCVSALACSPNDGKLGDKTPSVDSVPRDKKEGLNVGANIDHGPALQKITVTRQSFNDGEERPTIDMEE